jgi:F-type H+-transporting ATPase subunit gamma
MPTIEELKRKIDRTRDLQSVVKTMKALAAVNIRQFEKAVEALEDYHAAVEGGLQAALRNRPEFSVSARVAPEGSAGAIVFGSDQGMCGQLNEEIVAHTLGFLERQQVGAENRRLIAVGIRVQTRLEDRRQAVDGYFPVPGAVEGIAALVQKLVLEIENWRTGGLDSIFLFYCRPLSGSRYRPHHVHLLPIARGWLEEIRSRPWPTRQLPLFRAQWDVLFSALVRQYLFVSLYRAAAHSLASENASRLASMQGAERNIEEKIAELNQEYHRQRQMTITEELLDIVSGFEALSHPQK